jgi:hypothetical protein
MEEYILEARQSN